MFIMRNGNYLKFLFGIIGLVVIIKLSATIFAEPWIKKKIETGLNEKNNNFQIEIDRVNISLIRRGIKLKRIKIKSLQKPEGGRPVDGNIASIKFMGIHIAKALFKRNIDISKVTISNGNLMVKIPSPMEPMPAILSSLDIRMGNVLFDKINLVIFNTLTAKTFSVKESVLNIHNIIVEKQDTISPGIIKQFDFESAEILSVSGDSMYTFKAATITYSSASDRLMVRSFSVQPNYTDYNFTARYKYQKDRIETMVSIISLHNFSVFDFLKSGSIVSSYIEIGKMDMNVFRDCRKEIRHIDKPSFQDLFYKYASPVNIDSIVIKNGNITYTEHGTEANEPGKISFNEINANIYKITNYPIYRKKNTFLEFKGRALLMNKGRMTFSIKAKIFDSHNTFSFNGTLSNLEARELNPMLEKNAFVYVTSGNIDTMSYSFTANNAKATGKMTMLYHGFDLTVKNKRTDDTTALKERIISFIANKKLIDSNPVPGEDVRVGIIYYERDPQKSFINYCFKSVLSGINYTLIKTKKKNH